MKLSKYFSSFLIFCLVCGLFLSCSEPGGVKNNLNDLDQSNAGTSVTDSAGSNFSHENSNSAATPTGQNSNPLDWVGQEHNTMLGHFMNELENSYCNGDWDNITYRSPEHYALLSNIMRSSHDEMFPDSVLAVHSFEDVFEDMVLDEWFDGQNMDVLDIADNVLSDSASQKDALYTMNLLEALFNVSVAAASRSEAFELLDSVILEHELIILNQNWEDDETYALGALAVAKYSNEYWKNHPLSFSCSVSLRAPDPRDAIVVGADAAGYVVGGVVGGISGSFAGPAGSVGGFLGGKFAGFWIGSGAAGTAIAIYDSFVDFFGG